MVGYPLLLWEQVREESGREEHVYMAEAAILRALHLTSPRFYSNKYCGREMPGHCLQNWGHQGQPGNPVGKGLGDGLELWVR